MVQSTGAMLPLTLLGKVKKLDIYDEIKAKFTDKR
jgi:hypothetical protein